MNKKLHIFLFIAFIASTNLMADRGDYISDELLDTYSEADLAALWPLIQTEIENAVPCAEWSVEAEYGVELYKIVYETINAFEETTTSSGLLAIPTGNDCNMAMVNYNHGTQNGGALSNGGSILDLLGGNLAEWFISIPVATSGYIAVFPDYLGYGESACTDFHPYNHYKQARDVVDMIRATKQFCDMNSIPYSDELFVTGYSEGGYVAMATSKEIQEQHCEEMKVTAAAPLSGAYSVYPVSRDSLLAPSYNNISNLTYSIYAYNNLCPEILGEEGLSVAVLPEYANNITLAWDECDPQGTGAHEWTSPASGILEPAYVEDVTGNPCHPFNEVLRKSNMNNWIPEMPMRLYYIVTDEQVPYTNATTTAAWMTNLGADVQALTVQPCAEDSINHSTFAVPSLLKTLEWFDSIKSNECDYEVLIDPSTCLDPPAIQDLCPSEGVASTPFINFAIDGEDILFEELAYNDNCEIAVASTVTNTYSGFIVLSEENGVETADSSQLVVANDTVLGESPVTVDDFVYEYTITDDYSTVETGFPNVITTTYTGYIQMLESGSDSSQLVATVDTVMGTIDVYTTAEDYSSVDTYGVGVESIATNGLSIELQNNPVQNFLTLNIDNESNLTNADLVVYNINGQKLIQESIDLFSSQYQRMVADLSIGVYLLQIQLSDGNSQSIRFVKN